MFFDHTFSNFDFELNACLWKDECRDEERVQQFLNTLKEVPVNLKVSRLIAAFEQAHQYLTVTAEVNLCLT